MPFLLLALVVYWSLYRAHLVRLTFLALTSCAFYVSLSPQYIALIFVPTVVDFWVAKALDRTDEPQRRKWLLAFSVVTNLGLLFAFKYFDWFLTPATFVNGRMISGAVPFGQFQTIIEEELSK